MSMKSKQRLSLLTAAAVLTVSTIKMKGINMSKKLSDVPMKDLKLRTKVIGAHGLEGEITKIHLASLGQDRHDSLTIAWEDGSVSPMSFHNLLNRVTLKED